MVPECYGANGRHCQTHGVKFARFYGTLEPVWFADSRTHGGTACKMPSAATITHTIMGNR
jgi:hypothetical protein